MNIKLFKFQSTSCLKLKKREKVQKCVCEEKSPKNVKKVKAPIFKKNV